MRYLFLVATAIAILSLSPTQTSAHFFPNISSIPPWILSNATSGAWDAFRNFTGCQPGNKTDGLAKLKKYFHYFGYIPDLPSNFTDDFDDMLESAVKTYQKNFNLEPTGQLDNRTMQHILRPRCGNPDVVNGTTTMNSGKPTSYNATTSTNGHFHTVGHYSFFPGTPRWPSNKRDLTYAFLPDNQLTGEVKNVFATAFDRWSEVTSLTFTQTDYYSTADIRIGFFTGDHGDGEPFDGAQGTLAHAFSPTNGRFHLDGDENWVITSDSTTSISMSAIDLESVAVHEIGHLLGLGHSSVEESIMYPSIASGSRKVELANDDIQGIQSLYGSNPNFNGSSVPSAQQRDTSDAHRASFLGSWLGLSFFVVIALLGL